MSDTPSTWERARRAPDVHPACPRVLASIEAAARDGQVPIGAEDGH